MFYINNSVNNAVKIQLQVSPWIIIIFLRGDAKEQEKEKENRCKLFHYKFNLASSLQWTLDEISLTTSKENYSNSIDVAILRRSNLIFLLQNLSTFQNTRVSLFLNLAIICRKLSLSIYDLVKGLWWSLFPK